MKTNTLTAERLHALAELHQQGQVSDLMDRTLEKLLHHEADRMTIADYLDAMQERFVTDPL